MRIFQVIVASLCIVTAIKDATANDALKEMANNIMAGLGLESLQKYIQPLMKHVSVTQLRSLPPRPKLKSMEKAIELKVNELKDYLQDHEPVTAASKEVDSDTTILEFIPKQDADDDPNNVDKTFRSNNDTKIDKKKYKKMREKINRALDKETVSNKTKKYIIKKFDKLVDELLRSQCTGKTKRYKNNIGNSTKQKLENFRHTFLNKIVTSQQPNISLELTDVLTKFSTFIDQLSKDVSELSKNYNIRCQFTNKKLQREKLSPKLRFSDAPCNEIRLCSKELKEYLYNFFDTLNDTCVTFLSNYAAMYSRDVNSDGSHERQNVENAILKMVTEAQPTVSKVFTHELKKLELAKNKEPEKNIAILVAIIETMVDRLETKIKKSLEKNLLAVKPSIGNAVKEDVSVSLDTDLRKMAKIAKTALCQAFSKCNGNTFRKRFSPIDATHTKDIYVELQLNVGDTVKGIVIPETRRLDQIFDSTATSKYIHMRQSNRNRILVTRTSNTGMTVTEKLQYMGSNYLK